MLTEVTLPDIEYICLHLRESDKREILNMRPHDSPLQLAWESFSAIINLGRGRVAWHKGRPAGLFAFTESWPGLWEVWMFGTDEFRSVAIDLMRYCRKEANDILTLHHVNVGGTFIGSFPSRAEAEDAARAAVITHRVKHELSDDSVVPVFIGNGRRLQCDCAMEHPEAHKLIRAMGAIAEGPPMQSYGKDGSAYQRYVWLNGVNDQVLRPNYTRAA